MVEILAVREAFILFASSQWSHSHRLIIESDSTNADAVCWTNFPLEAPWAMRRFINHIESLKCKIMDWSVIHISRDANSIADALAQEGVHKEEDWVEFL
ncbi:hypothetical protein PTKIN_Ptkin16aG0500700 [Pterospermum kingtungense]